MLAFFAHTNGNELCFFTCKFHIFTCSWLLSFQNATCITGDPRIFISYWLSYKRKISIKDVFTCELKTFISNLLFKNFHMLIWNTFMSLDFGNSFKWKKSELENDFFVRGHNKKSQADTTSFRGATIQKVWEPLMSRMVVKVIHKYNIMFSILNWFVINIKYLDK